MFRINNAFVSTLLTKVLKECKEGILIVLNIILDLGGVRPRDVFAASRSNKKQLYSQNEKQKCNEYIRIQKLFLQSCIRVVFITRFNPVNMYSLK